MLSNDHQQWSVPLCARFGRGETTSRQCFLVDKPQQTFAVAGGCADWYLPNADATGYYRFTMSDSDFAALNRRVASLSSAEQMIVADAIKSAFQRGDLAPATVLDAMPALAKSDLPQVAFALSGDLVWMRRHLATDATRSALDGYAARLYASKLAELGYRHRPGEEDAVSRMRQRLVSVLAFDARNPAVRAELNRQGRLALGLDGAGGVDLTRADPDLRGFALKVAVQDSGVPAFEAVLGELKGSHATQERYELVSALGSTRDPVLADRARDLGLTGAVAVGEMARLYFAQVDEEENREAFWTWYQAHFDALRARFPDSYQRTLARLPAAQRCDSAWSDRLRDWLAPHLDQVIGGKRALAQSVEGISQCAALREHVGSKALANWAETQRAQ